MTGPFFAGARRSFFDRMMNRVVLWASSSTFSLRIVEAVELGGKPRRERRPGRVAALGHFARRAGGVALDDRLPAVLADDLPALAERRDLAVDDLNRFERRPLWRHELEMDRQEVLADDVEAGSRQQVVDVGDAARERIFDRDHGELGRPVLDRGKAVLEGRAGHGLVVGVDLLAGEVGIRSGLALEHDLLGTGHGVRVAA